MSIAEFISTTSLGRAARPRQSAPPTFPTIEPGQLWLIELPAAGGSSSASAHHAVDGANVVIYDRVLTDWLAASLPLGTYAEPTPDSLAGAASRCVSFARDGWSVARLLPAGLPRRERIGEVRRLVEALAAARAPSDRAVQVFAETAAGICEPAEARLDHLAQLVATYPRDTRLTIVVGAIDGGVARPHAVAGNGLAG